MALFVAAVTFTGVRAETHTATFTNQCGYGTPNLSGPNGVLSSTGQAVTFNSPAEGLYAYLQTGNCGSNGEGCPVVNASLVNGDSCASTEILPPDTIGFCFYNGCDGVGFDCTSRPTDPITGQEVYSACCAADNVDLAITFCP